MDKVLMTENNTDQTEVTITEHAVLEKFDGEGTDPENLVERITAIDGKVVQHEFIENGEVVATYDTLQGGELDASD